MRRPVNLVAIAAAGAALALLGSLAVPASVQAKGMGKHTGMGKHMGMGKNMDMKHMGMKHMGMKHMGMHMHMGGMSGMGGMGGMSGMSGMSDHFTSALSGSNETPAVATPADGVATFVLSKDGNTLHYVLTVHHITGVMKAHIHMMSGGQAGGMSGMSMGSGGMAMGSMVATLFDAPSPTSDMDGKLVSGDITGSDLIGPLAGHPLSDLVNAMMQHELAVNVHTMDHPGGEIGGPITMKM
jgi:hypothetical protein